MPISTDPSTYEFARDWLVSSETFCRDALGADALDLDTYRAQARDRIHFEEAFAEPDLEEANEATPDQPSPLAGLPRVILRMTDYRERLVGIGTHSCSGTIEVCVEVPVPEAYQINYADDDAATQASKFKDRKTWARQLWTTCKQELWKTRGQGDGDTPYLNAAEINGLPPADPEPQEGGDVANWVGWIWEVVWKG